jgi:hypothetical protein
MNAQGAIKARATGGAGVESTVGKEVVKEAVRLALNSCEEEERRWIAIGLEAEQALAEKSLSEKGPSGAIAAHG